MKSLFYLLAGLIVVSIIIWWVIMPSKPLPDKETKTIAIPIPDKIKSLTDLDDMVAKYELSSSWDQTYCNRMLQNIDDFSQSKKELSQEHANELKRKVLIKNATLFDAEINNFISTAVMNNRSRIASLLVEAQRINSDVPIGLTIQNINNLDEAFRQLSQAKSLFDQQYNSDKFNTIENTVGRIISTEPLSRNTFLRSELSNLKSERRKFSDAVSTWEVDLSYARDESQKFIESLKKDYYGYKYYLNRIEEIERERFK